MALNWTVEVLASIISIIPFTLAFLMLVIQIIKGLKYKYFIYAAILWFIMVLFAILISLAILFQSTLLYLTGFLMTVPIWFLLLLKSDVISRESIEPVKLSIFAFLAAVTFLLAFFDPKSFNVTALLNGDSSIVAGFPFNIVYGIATFLANAIYIYNLVKVALNAPKDVKQWAYLYLTGMIVMGVIGLSLYFIFPPLCWLLFGSGALLMAFAVVKQPKIIFVLPFKAYRLAVIQNTSGLPLFTYTWNTGDVLADEILSAGMLQAINLFVRESLGKGDLKEVHVSDAIILVKQIEQFPVVSVVIATKASGTLRDGLNIFTRQFCEEYGEIVGDPINQSKFTDAIKLIGSSFPYVPEFG